MTGKGYRSLATAILAAGWLVMVAITAPGFMTWDSVTQLADARSGIYNSWHPPVMAWLLGVFDAIMPGTLLFLIFQSALLLFALLALLSCRRRNGVSIVMAAVVVLSPQWLLFQGEIWKDILFADAAIAGFAALALLARKWRFYWLILSLLLLTLAASTRQNGILLLPVAAVTLALIARARAPSGWRHGAGFLIVALLLYGSLNLALAVRGDHGEGARAQLQLGQAYDLAGALARRPSLPLPDLRADPRLDAALRREAAPRFSVLRVDTMAGDPTVSAALAAADPGLVSRAWWGLVRNHTALYLAVRWQDFRAVFLPPDPRLCHFAPVGVGGDPARLQSLGMRARIRPRDQALAVYAGRFFATPVYSHLAWGLLALGLLVWLGRRRCGADVAVAGLLVGALLFTATFAIISIACDYRYLLFLDLSAVAGALYALGSPADAQERT